MGEDVDDITVLEFVLEGNDAAVDFGADAEMADVGVDGVGEVDGEAAGGGKMNVPRGGKA